MIWKDLPTWLKGGMGGFITANLILILPLLVILSIGLFEASFIFYLLESIKEMLFFTYIVFVIICSLIGALLEIFHKKPKKEEDGLW